MGKSQVSASKMMSEAKFFESYSRFKEEEGTYESWDESVDRVMEMHRQKYAEHLRTKPKLATYFGKITKAYKEQRQLGAQRALQFGGEQLLKHNIRMYNCVSSWVDRAAFFGECMYMLLCGAGTGFSVQRHHIAKLPSIQGRSSERVVFTIPDSIEGWAQSVDVLLSSFFTDAQKHPEYAGKRVVFDYDEIRPKGAKISGGFKAPGPDPLRKALDKIENLLEEILLTGATRLRPIHCYDIVMHSADAVISGGVRRSATICMFDFDDEEMMNAKTGNWFNENPQRGRSNNSAVCVRSEITRENFAYIMRSVRQFGEPGFIFTNDRNITYNPCVEIGKYPCTIAGVSGWQGCNLNEINGGLCKTKEDFFLACETAAALGTLQAGYTDFKFLSAASKEIFEGESLIGVSITGWMNSADILFDDEILAEGARIVKRVNKEVAALIGINQAARTTCAKPAGNASVLLQTASGVHGEHAPMYLRNVTIAKGIEVGEKLRELFPEMVEESKWSKAKSDWMISFPIIADPESIFKHQLLGVKQLAYVKKAQQIWVEGGTNVELCRVESLRHNISNTIQVDDWDAVEQYVWDNKEWFAGISFLAAGGDRAFVQAPFSTVFTAPQLAEMYGNASMFASGLLVQGVEAYGCLWAACSSIETWAVELEDNHENLNKRDFTRRLRNFATNYFDGDLQQATYCLKDVWLLHRWEKIQKVIEPVDWISVLSEKRETDVDTMGAIACAGGFCEAPQRG